jgi:hypothetical protein
VTFKQFLTLMLITTGAAWFAFGAVVWSIDPTRSGLLGFVFFYATLSLALVGTLTICGAGLRTLTNRDEVVSRHVSKAFRQAFLFTILVDLSLVLSSQGYFRWWTATILILLLAIVELVFLSAQRPRA